MSLNGSECSPIPFDSCGSKELLLLNDSFNSQLTSASNSASDYLFDKDEKCIICNKWCINYSDFDINFLSCKTCIHSYHKRCIPIIYHTQNESLNCYEIKNKFTNKSLKCCNTNRQPNLLLNIIGKKFDKINYFYNSNGIKTSFNLNNDNIKHKLFMNKNKNNKKFSKKIH